MFWSWNTSVSEIVLYASFSASVSEFLTAMIDTIIVSGLPPVAALALPLPASRSFASTSQLGPPVKLLSHSSPSTSEERDMLSTPS